VCRVSLAGNIIARIFACKQGPVLLDDPVVLPNLNGGLPSHAHWPCQLHNSCSCVLGLQHPSPEIRRLTAKVLVRSLQQTPSETFIPRLLSSDVAAALVRSVADEVGPHIRQKAEPPNPQPQHRLEGLSDRLGRFSRLVCCL
jgi:hypothetical protein